MIMVSISMVLFYLDRLLEFLRWSLATKSKDSIAELIEIAPTTAINLLDGLLLTEPASGT